MIDDLTPGIDNIYNGTGEAELSHLKANVTLGRIWINFQLFFGFIFTNPNCTNMDVIILNDEIRSKVITHS